MLSRRSLGKRLLTGLAIGVVLSCSAEAFSAKDAVRFVKEASTAISNEHSYDVPAKGRLEVAFSPDEGSESLVLRVIDSAAKPGGEILMLTYSFTSAPVAQALAKAVHKGATVRIVADYRSNAGEDKSGKARAALSIVKTAGADVRTIRAYPIHHDKVIIANRRTVELGSFNYSAAAASKNSENVLVNWDNPELATVYIEHFNRNYRQAEPFQTQY